MYIFSLKKKFFPEVIFVKNFNKNSFSAKKKKKLNKLTQMFSTEKNISFNEERSAHNKTTMVKLVRIFCSCAYCKTSILLKKIE